MVGDRARQLVITVATVVWAGNFLAALIPPLEYEPDQAINGIFMVIVGAMFALPRKPPEPPAAGGGGAAVPPAPPQPAGAPSSPPVAPGSGAGISERQAGWQALVARFSQFTPRHRRLDC